jgi:hypothetical protein
MARTSPRTRARVRVGLMIAVCTASCGSSVVTDRGSPSGAVTNAGLAGEGPPVNWDRPFPDGIDVPLAEASSAKSLQRAGHLRFLPVLPDFTSPPRLVQVAPADGSVVFVYDFPQNPEFPSDGRVRVLERQGLTPSDVAAMAKANAKQFPGDVTLLSIAGTIPAQLSTNKTLHLGGVVMSINDVWIDIAGPALSPDAARKLAETFGG